MGIAPALLKNLAAEGYLTPTPIQARSIPALLSGRDVLGCAQTGTGKTAAFALPILQRLMTPPAGGSPSAAHGTRPARLPRALILSPTRELATQIAQSFATYGKGTGLRGTVIFGGVGQNPQVQALRHGVDVLVATPGRLIDLLEQGLVDLSAVSMFVLDEADRMLDMGFIQPIRRIVAALPRGTPRQTLLFSATMPREIMHLAEALLRDPVKVTVAPAATTVPLIEQKLYHLPRADKLPFLGHMLEAHAVQRAVVFTKTKHGADKLCRKLHLAGISATAIHGNKGQNQRERALDAFRDGRVRVLVATDVAARGLDVDGITHVVNFDLPMEPEAYVHRIGRTGRAGATGIAVSFCDPSERDLLRDIERVTGKRIPTAPVPESIPALKMRTDLSEHSISTHPRAHAGAAHGSASRAAPRGRSGGHPGSRHGAPTRDTHDRPQTPRRDSAPRRESAAPARNGWHSAGRGRRGR
ncbi:MAG: DEAD/DEAH box helicase [Phycisphaerales bacterium]